MLIHLEKLGKSFGEKVVLHDVSASVEKKTASASWARTAQARRPCSKS